MFRIKNSDKTTFIQQTLPEWRPDLNAARVSRLLFIVGIIFVPVGILISGLSSDVVEEIIDYTECISNTSSKKETCAQVIGYFRNITCTCRVSFTLYNDIIGPVYIYYGLTNFYQNHQKYLKSRDDVQLLGHLSNEVSNDCKPYAYVEENGIRKPIAPCGAVANSMFSDELTLSYKKESSNKEELIVPFIRKGIAWESDKKYKYRNPPGDLKEAFKNYAKPVDWQKNIWELDPGDPSNNGFQNEDFIVWMRSAALPDFKKLYRLVNHTAYKEFSNGLPAGNYVLNVVYSYPVAEFGGTKKLVINNASSLYYKSPFLGFAYVIVGSIIILFSIALQLIDRKYGKNSVSDAASFGVAGLVGL